MSSQTWKIRRVTLSVELYDGTRETVEVSDPARVMVNVDTQNQEEHFDSVMGIPFRVPISEPLTLTIQVGRKEFTDSVDTICATRQQELAMVGKAENQCGLCGSYRSDGRPPLVHRVGCPDAVDVGGVRDWWMHERITGVGES